MREVKEHLTRLVAAVVIAIAVMPVFASPAKACSCAMPPNIDEWVGESEAAFVGTLVDKRDGVAGEFGPESIYVFEVEEWVKGDAGDVIEVRSPSDGAACGFEFWNPDQRIGAILHQEGGELHGGLCSQIEPDVLLAAAHGPTPSATGIGHLLIGGGWASSRTTVVDEEGHHVIDLVPPGAVNEFDSGGVIASCPTGELMVQATPTDVVVWDLGTYEIVDRYPLPNGFVSDISCRDPEASSIWVLTTNDTDARLFEIVPERTKLVEVPGTAGTIGTDYVVIQETWEGDATVVDVATGAETQLTGTPPDVLRSVSVASHPTRDLVAVVQTTFAESGPTTATLTIVDSSGTVIDGYPIPWETYSPTWLDETRVAVKAYDFNDWETSFGFVFDIETGEMIEIEGWDMEHTVADGDVLYGVSRGSVFTADLDDPVIEPLVTVPFQEAGPLVLMQGGEPIAPTTTIAQEPEPTTPPLEVEPTTPPQEAAGNETEAPNADGYIWLVGSVVVALVGILVWLGLRPKTNEPS